MDTWSSARKVISLSVVIVATVVIVLTDPVAQDPAYHAFADDRSLFGIPNFFDVMSNLPFVAVGAAGLVVVTRGGLLIETVPAWQSFFAGVLLTAVGSGYYHLQPDNATLLWDRLPMTVAFMSFVSIVVSEYLSPWAARRLLIPLLLVGVSSVFYWSYTESAGHGDLRAYVVVQFLPMLLIPFIVVIYRRRSDLGSYIGAMIVFYIAAKLLEFFDTQVFSAAGFVSGHSLKHVIAAMAPATLLYGLMRRRYHAPRT